VGNVQLRKFGKTNESVSLLGFGCMRLPQIDDNTKNIDQVKAIQLIRDGIDSGINYIDTAWGYHGEMSEPLVGKALQDGYREKVHLATKLPSWLIEKTEDMEYYLNKQLEKLQTDHIDFYLVHTLNTRFWDNLKACELFAFLDKIKADGRVKHVGFSFHDQLPLFKEIVDSYDWSFCQIQLNYMDTEYQAGLEGLHYAAERNLGIVIMEPLRGGNIVNNIPDDIMKIWQTSVMPDRKPADWALRYVMNMPEVHVVLSGMGLEHEVNENIETAKNAEPNHLSDVELGTIKTVSNIYNDRTQVNCTQCAYCMPCPAGVQIPKVFHMFNGAYVFNDIKGYKNNYHMFISPAGHASNCTECGACEVACPQNIPIIETMKRVVEDFE